MHGNELGYTSYCFGTNYTWGNQTISINNSGEGTEVLLARFNKNNGECVGLAKINGDIGYDNSGTALAVDASGDYILGGAMGHQLFVNANTTLLNNGPQSDFFVAKYSTSLCSPLAVNEVLFPKVESPLVVAPNPAKNETTVFYNYVDGASNKSISILDVLGRTLNSFLPKENKGNFVLNTSGYANGTYFVLMKEDGKIIERTKLVIKN